MVLADDQNSLCLRHGTKTDPRQVDRTGPGKDYSYGKRKRAACVSLKETLADKRYPGNPAMPCRIQAPLRINGDITDWQGHAGDERNVENETLERLEELLLRQSRGERD